MGSSCGSIAGKVYYNLSFYDLLSLPDFKLAVKLEDKEAMERILWNLGMDTTQKYEIIERLHRTLSRKEPWQGLRVEGFERLDREWLRSGSASTEAKLYTEDASLTEVLSSLDPSSYKTRKRNFEDDAACSVEVYDGDCV